MAPGSAREVSRGVPMRSTGLRPGEVAAAAGVGLQTLRYYERRGLIVAPPRTIGGHRQYGAETVTVLRVIKAAQRLGFTLSEVAAILESAAGRTRRRGPDLEQRIRGKLDEIDERIAELDAVRGVLRDCLEAGCSDLLTCADHDDCPVPFDGRG